MLRRLDAVLTSKKDELLATVEGFEGAELATRTMASSIYGQG